jgi:hypothetical protein
MNHQQPPVLRVQPYITGGFFLECMYTMFVSSEQQVQQQIQGKLSHDILNG